MLEKVLESKICKYAKSRGCVCWKFSSPSFVGVPDRILICPNGVVGFIEVKAKGKKPSTKQLHVMKLIKAMGVPVEWVDSLEDAQKFIDEIFPF